MPEVNNVPAPQIEHTKSAGKPDNEIEALKAISRDIKGQRAKVIKLDDGATHISVSNLSYVSSITNN